VATRSNDRLQLHAEDDARPGQHLLYFSKLTEYQADLQSYNTPLPTLQRSIGSELSARLSCKADAGNACIRSIWQRSTTHCLWTWRYMSRYAVVIMLAYRSDHN
ncbi:hypothetical protein, partial [Xanthomonas fragariae]|uniref:hypothetical protein n=1 Tax=Xanthomonas fragariae TaxID=48664 RepID=UPI001F1A5FC6